MKAYPHTYSVSAQGSAIGAVPVVSQGLPAIETAPPPEFDGPGGVWSPKTLLVAAIANCFILTFRGVSRAARFAWEKLEARVDGTLNEFRRHAIHPVHDPRDANREVRYRSCQGAGASGAGRKGVFGCEFAARGADTRGSAARGIRSGAITSMIPTCSPPAQCHRFLDIECFDDPLSRSNLCARKHTVTRLQRSGFAARAR